MKKAKLDTNTILIFALFLGIVLRFVVMSFGWNYDFESYCIVGKLASEFKSVYANTMRYNYGPVFFIMQGTLYKIANFCSSISKSDVNTIFRVLMVGFLTLFDLLIAQYVASNYSKKASIIFFLNPVSIFITGFHNQFDIIAIYFLLLSLKYYNEEKSFNRNDIKFVLMFALSLATKHIFFLLPGFIFLRKTLSFKKKALYCCVPPVLFLLSFVPFIIGNQAALDGVKNNVFLYFSYDGSPLLRSIYLLIGFPERLKLVVFVALMALLAFVTRKYKFETQVLLYLIGLVCFTSQIANQYLAIPMVAICVLCKNWLSYIYMFFVSAFLLLHGSGLNLIKTVSSSTATTFKKIMESYLSVGYTVAAWILLVILIIVIRNIEKNKKMSGEKIG